MYFPATQGFWQGWIAIRSDVSIAPLVSTLRAAGREVDPSLTLWNARAMDDLLSVPLAQPRIGALLMSAFGIVALVLAAAGLYGIMASLVRDQTREMGIRVALGAAPSRLRNEVMAKGTRVAVIGALLGVPVALLLSRALSSLLYHVKPTDPVSLGGAALVLVSVAAAAAYLPARRATRIDPALALKSD